MNIGEICSREVDVIAPDETARAAAQRMLQRNVGSLVVVDAARVPVGIVTDRDLTVRVLATGRRPEDTSVADVMTRRLQVIDADAPVQRALALMQEAGCRRLPVLRADGELCGLAALDDVIDWLARETGVVAAVLRGTGPKALDRT
jgi:CBS domain-containing protein